MSTMNLNENDEDLGNPIKDGSGRKLKPCPECGSDGFLSIDSSSYSEQSWVNCDCGHYFICGATEHYIGRNWNKHTREYVKG